MYVPPATTTPKTTWQDMDRLAENTDPIILDSAGRCVIWGEGIYRQILLDMNDNVVWDKLTLSFTSVDDVLALLDDALTTYYDLAFCRQGFPDASEELFRFVVVRNVRLPAGLTGSQFKCKVNPTAPWVFTLFKNGVSIGTITLSVIGVAAVVFASDVDFVAGDVFSCTAQAIQDLTGAYPSFTFVETVL